MQREYYEHHIRLDDMMELKMKIPVTLSVLELKALMVKADKLFKLSEVQIVPESASTQRRRQGIKNRFVYNKEVLKDLVNLKRRGVTSTLIVDYLNKTYGEKRGVSITSSKINSKYFYLSSKGVLEKLFDSNYKIPEFFLARKKGVGVQQKPVVVAEEIPKKKSFPQSIYTTEILEKMEHLIGLGFRGKHITGVINKEFNTNYSIKQVSDKVKNILKKQSKRKNSVESSSNSKFTDEQVLVMVQMFNDGHKNTEIRDALNSQFGTNFSKITIKNKIYNLKKQGRLA